MEDAVFYQEGCLSEIGPDLVSGVITVDDRIHTTEILAHSAVGVRSHYSRAALVHTGSPPPDVCSRVCLAMGDYL